MPFTGVARRRLVATALLASGLCTPAARAVEAPYLLVLARLLADDGEVADAREHLARAVELAPDEPYLRLEYAALLANLGRWREASEQASRARELATDDPEVLRAYGQIHLVQAGENPQALGLAQAAFEDLRERAPTDLESQLALARIYLSQGEFDEAAAVYREVLAYWPGHPGARSALVEALVRGSQPQQAEEALQGFLAADPAALALRLKLADLLVERGEHRAAIDVLQATDEGTRGQPEVSRRLAVAQYRTGDPQGALDSVAGWLAAEPDDLQARLLQSLLLSSLGREAEAITALEELRRSRPDDLEVATLLARHHALRRDWEATLGISEPLLAGGVDADRAEIALLSAEALRGDGRGVEALDRLALIAPGFEQHPRAVALSAEILFELDRTPEAEELLLELVADGTPEPLALAAAVYQRADRYLDAIGVLERLLELDPGRTEALFWLGAAYERTRDYQRAEDSFRRLLAVEPDFAPALNYLGYMWADRGTNLDEALSMVERAVDLEPDNGAYLDSLGWTHFQRGDYAAAQGHLERAAALEGDDATVLEHLGDLYRALGRVEEASSAYRRALDLQDENLPTVRRKLEALGPAN